MRVVLLACVLVLGGCAWFDAGLGRISSGLTAVWVGEDRFVYVPGAYGATVRYETAKTARLIVPGLMYTDGGSIPRVARAFKGFSPWGYAPAYIVHDWIFFGRHCLTDARLGLTDPIKYADARRFADVNGDPTVPLNHPQRHPVEFDESAVILAEVIKTMADYGQIQKRDFAGAAISAAVDSVPARVLWERTDACREQRVTPRDIAVVWLLVLGNAPSPPPSWKLSTSEIADARTYFPVARKFLKEMERPGGAPRQTPKSPIRPPQVATAQ